MTSDAEIVEKVRAGYDAFNRGDFDGAVAMLHPDVEYIPPGGLVPHQGRAAVRAWMEPSAWASQVIEPLEITVAGSRILMHGRTTARGAGSGIEMAVESWIVMTFDDELLVTRIETFFPHEEAQARQAAGLGTA